MKTVDINGCNLAFEENPSIHISEYYNYCLKLIIKEIESFSKKININFSFNDFDFQNNLKTINIGLQYEHTLVKKNGRSLNHIFNSNTKSNDGENYLIRIENYPTLLTKDLIIDYSLPNIFHISTNEQLFSYSQKCRYVPALIYECNFNSNNRNEFISNFSSWSSRRSIIFSKIKENFNSLTNITNCFTKDEILNQYEKTKVLINVHQTEEHHTLEELRVLPALSQGVIIISEDVPLKEQIPYHNHIIWSEYNDLDRTVKEVIDNYDFYYQSIFNQNLLNIFNEMRLKTKIL